MAFYIVGAGGFGREVLDAVLASAGAPGAVEVTAFADEAVHGAVVRGLPVLHPADLAAGEFVVGIADPVARRRLAEALAGAGLAPRTVVHPRAVVGPETAVGDGSVILANAHVSSSVTLGRHVQVNYNATVGHDAVLGDYVTIYPGANVSGAVHLGAGVTMGTNSCVLQGRRIAGGTMVGAGAVVTRDVPEPAVMVGVPARPRPRPPTCR